MQLKPEGSRHDILSLKCSSGITPRCIFSAAPVSMVLDNAPLSTLSKKAAEAAEPTKLNASSSSGRNGGSRSNAAEAASIDEWKKTLKVPLITKTLTMFKLDTKALKTPDLTQETLRRPGRARNRRCSTLRMKWMLKRGSREWGVTQTGAGLGKGEIRCGAMEVKWLAGT